MERVKRNELERVAKKHEVSIDGIVGIFFRAGDEIHSLRRNQRTLSGFAAILAKEGRKRNEMAERLLNIVKSVEDEQLVLINESGVAVEGGAVVKWEDKRDFYLISFDHFSWNGQTNSSRRDCRSSSKTDLDCCYRKFFKSGE